MGSSLESRASNIASNSSSGWFTHVFNHFNVVYKVGIILLIWGTKCIVDALSDAQGTTLIRTAVENLNGVSVTTLSLGSSVLMLIVAWLYLRCVDKSIKEPNAPPFIPSPIPFIGCAIEFNKNPVQFLIQMKEKYGPVFSFEMVGTRFTYLIGSEASSLLFNSKNEDLNAEAVYQKLVTPVFGKGVAYDVPNDVFLEQKKMFKNGLNVGRFREYVHTVEAETRNYLARWGESGQVDLFNAFSEMIIMTASHCLHGKEIRAMLSERVAHLYYELDQGFCAEAWLLPSWLHWIIPKLRRRDRAHKEIKKIFYTAIAKRRASGEKGEDMLQTLMDTPYKSGRLMTDDEIAGMLIGLLMAGQHTSSSTSSWLGLFLAKHKDIQAQCYEEQHKVRGTDFAPVDYDQLKNMTILDCCFKEALRLQPPIYTIMRQANKPLDICGFTVPAGHSVCVSPTTNQRLEEVWGHNCTVFHPERFLDETISSENKFVYVPFGAGRHRCIGESFAYVQNKTIWSVLLELYELELVGPFPQPNYKGMIHTPETSIIQYHRRKHDV